MNKLLIILCLFSLQSFAQTVTPTRSSSAYTINQCTTTVNIIAPTQYSDNSAITNAPVYDIYEKACAAGISCRGVPWVQTVTKQLQSNITLSCAGKPNGHIYKGRPCNATDNSVCAGYSYFIIGGAN